MYRILAAWLMIWSIATHMKLVSVSTTGLMPTSDEPMAAPKKPFSESGVSSTRFSPNSDSRFAVAPYTARRMSSPMM